MKILIWVGASILLLVLGAGTYFTVKIGPRNLIGMIRYDQRQEGSLKVGDPAPDVALVGLDGAAEVRLHDRIGARPLVLVFGSYT